MYAELHCHTNYSFKEGASAIDELLPRARELGYRALAITDHDNLCGAMQFAQVARSLDLQPIVGAEITLKGGHHLTLLAETRQGYSNLCRLVSYAYIAADRRKPELDPKYLPEHAEGLLLLTGCRKGRVAALLTEGRDEEAETEAKRYLEWFGQENVFVELQQNLAHGDTPRNRGLVGLARRLDVPVVATNNVHYHTPDRRRLQDALVSIQHNKSLEETHRQRRPSGQFYLKSPEEMASLFQDCPEAVRNTVLIADRCGFDLSRDLGYRFPDYPVPEGSTPQTHLEELCYEAARRRYGDITDRVRQRLAEEFRLIEKHDLAGFFLIYHEIIQMARQVMIELGLSDAEIPLEERPPGRGRGSSVAMLMGYLIGLSHIDPLEFDLSLERFLHDEMGSVPDIDLDFPRDIREELIKRVHERWGWDRAVLTGMISTYKIKGAIRDLGKALGLPLQDVDKLAKRVDSYGADSLKLEMQRLPEFRDRVDAPVWRDLIDLAAQLDGFPKYLAQHPGGMVISSSPMIEMVPVQQGAIDGRYVCHWDKDSIDDAGFVKIDFLALGALSQMQDALRLIEERTGHYVDLSRIDFEDEAVYDMLHRADTIGIFQVESAAQMQTIVRIKPKNLTEMAYEVGAVRPGVGVNDGVTQFIKRHALGEPWDYDHPLERRALERTLGIILFQDQVNQVAIDVAGFSPLEADQLRRVFLRRNNAALVEASWEKFREGAARNGVPEAAAEKIFKKFNGHYMFPESHAFAFGVTAYHMAWLKHYYPLEFFVGIFNQQPMGFYNLETLKEDARRHGIVVLNPDINLSREKSTVSRPLSNSPPPAGERISPFPRDTGESQVKGRTSSSGSSPDGESRSRPVGALVGAWGTLPDPYSSGVRVSQEGGGESPPKNDVLSLDRLKRRTPLSGESADGGVQRGYPPLVGAWGAPPEIYYSPSPSARERGTQGVRVSQERRGESQNDALLLGLLNVRGVGGAAATTIVRERDTNGPYSSLADFMRRTGIQREAVDNLLLAGAFDSLAPARRQAMWEAGLLYRPAGAQLALPLPVEQDMAELPSMSAWESMAGEYQTMGVYPRGHLMAHVRPHLPQDVTPSHEVPDLDDGKDVTVAGLVIRRQRPLAKAVFITLEDEFGHVPMIVWPSAYERYRLILREPVLLARGVVSRRDGTMNVVLTHAESVDMLLDTPSSKDWG